MEQDSSFGRFPTIKIIGHDDEVFPDFSAIRKKLCEFCQTRKRTVIVAECYPGTDQEEAKALLILPETVAVIHSDDLALPPEEIDRTIERDLTEDPIFGIMTARRLEEFFPAQNLEAARRKADSVSSGIVLIYGVGASLVCRGDLLILADITRWEIQLRYRRGMSNWRTARQSLPKNEKYKRGFFAEWRWADRIKDKLLPMMDFYLDMTTEHRPAMVSGEAYRRALSQTAHMPFRMVPYFDLSLIHI